MKQKLLLYGLLFFIVVIGVPYIMGMVTEQSFKEVSATLSSFDGFAVEVIEYERGIVSSKAKTRLTLTGGMIKKFLNVLEDEVSTSPPNKQAPKSLKVILDHDIRHGPFVRKEKGNFKDWLFVQGVLQSRLHLSDEAKKLLEEEMGENDFLQVATNISMDGDITIELVGKPIVVEEQDIEESVWQGIHAVWQISNNLQHIKGEVEIPGFYFDTEQSVYQGDGILLTTDRKAVKSKNMAHKEWAWKVKDKYIIDKLMIRPLKAKTLTMQGMFVSLDSVKENKGALKLNVDQVHLASDLHGEIQVVGTVSNPNSNHWALEGKLIMQQNLLPEMINYYHLIHSGQQQNVPAKQTIEQLQSDNKLQTKENKYIVDILWSAQDLGL